MATHLPSTPTQKEGDSNNKTTLSTPSSSTSPSSSSNTTANTLRSPASVSVNSSNASTALPSLPITTGAATSRFAGGNSSNSGSAPLSHSLSNISNTSTTNSRPSSPSNVLLVRSASNSGGNRGSPSSTALNRRANSSGGGAGGGASASAHNPINNNSISYNSPSTPQRPSSRGSYRVHTPSSALLNSPPPNSGSPATTEAALTSLQELIRTMPSAGTPTGKEKDATNLNDSPSSARQSPITVMSSSTTGGTSSSSTLPPPLTTRLRSTSSGGGGTSSSSSATSSTLNPNAGGFQPGALAVLGEVDNEVLITPQAATFGPGISSSPSNSNNGRQQAHGGVGVNNPYQSMMNAGGPFNVGTANTNSAATTNNNNNSNVFGSPIQTPQHQIGSHHNPYANTNTNPQEWQNFHNVFNAGIGNNNNNGTSGGGGNGASPNTTNINDFNTALANLNSGFMDFANNPALANLNSATANNNNISMSPMQAQIAMLQQMQQIQQQQAQQQANPQQQANLLLQQQSMQLQTLMAAQAQLHQSQQQQQQQQQQHGSNVSSPTGAGGFGGGVGVGMNIGLTGVGAGNNNPFMAEQMALQVQYEALRQQQQDLMTRFQEMQLQAAQLAQAQVVQQQQALSSPQSHHASPVVQHGSYAQQQQQQHSPHQSVHQQSQIGSGLPQSISSGSLAGNTGTGTRNASRRGPSQSISGMGMAANSGPMGQFGSMGQFALPTGGGNNANNVNSNNNNNNLPKGHGRRHSVNVAANKRAENINTAFSFPAGAGNPTQGNFNSNNNSGGAIGGPAMAQTITQADLGIGSVDENGNVLAAGQLPSTGGGPPPTRAFGHGRRESRGSIGSLAGWGSNSNIVTQSSVPIGQPTVNDLAQAQAQLQQLSQFRASAGHSRVPSFGIQQLQSTPGNNNNQQQQRKSLFAPYLPAASIPPLLQTGKLVIGVLRVNKRNRSDAYVATDVLDADVFICGSKDRNRALEGDVVAVELLDVDDVWGTKKEKEEKKRKKEESTSYDPKFQQQLRKQDKKRDDVEVEGQGLTLFEDEEVNDDQKPTYAGHVVAVVERQAGQLFAGTLGILRPSSAATKEKQDAERRERDGIDIRGGDEQKHRPKIVWFKPVDKRVPLVAIPADQAPSGFLDKPDEYVNTLFVACIKRWPITSLHPFGSLVEELGEIGNLEAESNALLKDCGFTDETFSDNVAKCLPPTPWTIPQTEIDARKDFRQCRVFTIDPETARDLDDALHINKLDDGTYEVGVHIADVSHFVKPNTALDREARRRGTTVYLVQRASPMLPEALSSVLCSLRPGEDRLTFSSVFKMTADGQVLSSWFGKSVIKSATQLSYNMAQQAIDENKLPDDLKIHDNHEASGIIDDIKTLDSMAKQMRARRFENGALRIDNVKLSFSLDDEGRPDDCVVYERKDSHSLIEEFMLTANQAVAQKIASGLPEQALLRRHETPIARRLEGFNKRAGKLGYDFDITSAGSLMKSFKNLNKEDPELVLRLLATKAMLRATYICSGMFDIAKYHHYALNIPIYTHFTSPIRRYADVVVHRQLEASLTDNPEGRFLMDPEAVSKIAQHCNTKKAAAKLAQEASQHLYLCTLVSDLTQKYGPVCRQAHVIGVLDQAFDVVVEDFGIEKRVHVDQMPIENHVHDERSNTLQLYWKKGVDVIKFLADNSGDPHLQRIRETAEQHARLMEASSQSVQAESALFEDDEQEEGQVQEVATSSLKSRQQLKSVKKAAPIFEGIEETSAGHCIQTVKELQTVPVVISADLTVCPPVIKVMAVNPFTDAVKA